MEKVLSSLSKYRVSAGVALLMMLVELAVELSQPFIIAKIIDEGIAHKNLQVVWLWGGVLAGGALIAFAAGICSSFYASYASQGFGYDLRERLYGKVQSFTYEVFNRFAASSLITRLTGDVSQVQDTVFMALRFMTRIPLVVAGSVLMALIVNFRLGLMLAATLPLLLLFVGWMIGRASSVFQTVQRRLDKVNAVIQENLTGIRLIRVFVRMGHEVKRFGEAGAELMKGTVRALRLTETTQPFIMLIVNAAIIAILWYGRLDIAAGSATEGQTVAVINYALRTIGAMSMLAWIAAMFSRAGASSRRIREVLNADPSEAQAASGTKPLAGSDVEFRSVGFTYPESSIPILENISFHARAGQRVAIMGATGSGKSSLVQLILRLYEPTSGVIAVGGTELRELDVQTLRRAIGYVPQDVTLFSGTVSENISWGNEHATEEQIAAAAKAAQLHETIMRLPDGYGTMLGQRGVNLSGGQKQRLSIARALVREPKILILDDSTSALDLKTEALLLQELEAMSCTTFLITQKISSTVSADLILLLEDGRLTAAGRHDRLMADSELYRRIYESQYGEEARHA
ncbi:MULTISPECIES: ABC transporter ATP-binding protein [unclassified Paenibacillus]|uniref:ABC transporter ATP-binding protein n=1 Tax=unclassified Paenibacillus TaxID=185978 RepID=UPI000953ECF9|nr:MULTISPECIES: ABC transporter ATP-binding protein [unclassified Paenibacillus]ASS68316.1 ABC transporter ATP-binding protein [Paenibacillus sp. RUD330]SIR28690.1 ATP-binding cassette, subfamily B [Paenibacillus sp. RU4X]SIR40986.1 ATP-binding cassette, subfamily B [Paenibacillus sp. RU4T]